MWGGVLIGPKFSFYWADIEGQPPPKGTFKLLQQGVGSHSHFLRYLPNSCACNPHLWWKFIFWEESGTFLKSEAARGQMRWRNLFDKTHVISKLFFALLHSFMSVFQNERRNTHVPSPTCHWAASDALRTSLSVKMPGSGALTPKLMERHMTWLYYEIDILRPPRDFGRLPLPKWYPMTSNPFFCDIC